MHKNIRLLAEFASAREFVGDTERRTAAYLSVREDSSTGSTRKLPAEVELCKKSILTLTDKAVEHVKTLLAKHTKPALGIRVGVKSGGCSGIEYYIEYADEKNKFDEVIEAQGVKILIDPKALMYLIGSIMDYVESQFKSGFSFNNPNEKGRCGCGKSFSV